MSKTKACLGIGLTSIAALEAAYSWSDKLQGIELMILVSRNQVDYDGGYVGLTTRELGSLITECQKRWPRAHIIFERDHCGPGMKAGEEVHDFKGTYRTMDEDCAAGFQIIHIDFSRSRRVQMTPDAMDTILYIAPDMLFEVGGAENDGQPDTPEEVAAVLDVCSRFPVEFFALRTGSMLCDGTQSGRLNQEAVAPCAELIRAHQVRVKEHNADYLRVGEIFDRTGLVDAMNVAPEFGTRQTKTILDLCGSLNVDASDFMNAAYATEAWKRWAPEADRLTKTVVSGHYAFNTDAYKQLRDQLERHLDVDAKVRDELEGIIGRYVCSW